MVIVFISLLIVPALNLTLGQNAMPKSFPETFKKLYNMDIVESFTGYIGYKIGMSSDPGKVVVGHDGWLFLGDDISSPITTKIRGVDDKIRLTINEIHSNMHGWDNFFKRYGVKEFRVIIGPDKDSVYSEKTPTWNKQSDKKILQALTAGQNPLFVNTYDAFKIAKSKFIMPMYFHTDTHWNELGAVVAFNALVKTLNGADLNFHAETTENDFYLKYSRAGDLAAFLRINKFIDDQVVLHKDASIDNLLIKKYDFKS
ncbi:alginate O-acetyltransferase AlgX-related protein, partial [Enterobacter hormaechei]|uniref:alginate O-acetyltransferase AlgX-related protein n=1 Tax=Enterobacter hormaechei TaxID=158836 RepID=UPI0019532ED9